MTKLVSIGQAAKNALAVYLNTSLNNPKVLPAPSAPVLVEPRWPDPRQLKGRVITLVNAGARTYGSDPVLGWWHASELVDPQPPGLPPGLQMWRWSVGWYEQPIQMDIWTWYDEDRDDLIARLDVAMHAGPGETTSKVGDPIADYLILPLAQTDGWFGGYCGAYFAEDGPELIDTVVAAGQTMYRAKWAGTLEVLLTVDDPRYTIARNIFKIKMREDREPTADDPVDLTATYTDEGVTIT